MTTPSTLDNKFDFLQSKTLRHTSLMTKTSSIVTPVPYLKNPSGFLRLANPSFCNFTINQFYILLLLSTRKKSSHKRCPHNRKHTYHPEFKRKTDGHMQKMYHPRAITEIRQNFQKLFSGMMKQQKVMNK